MCPAADRDVAEEPDATLKSNPVVEQITMRTTCDLTTRAMGPLTNRHFRVFPLRGKLLNVREARHDTIMKNKEIQNVKILGLRHNKVYTDTSSLRYGRLMLTTDQVCFVSNHAGEWYGMLILVDRTTMDPISKAFSSTFWTTFILPCSKSPSSSSSSSLQLSESRREINASTSSSNGWTRRKHPIQRSGMLSTMCVCSAR